jgi:fatty-acid desaturase
MPFETIAYLAFVVATLGVFAAALTYAEWATRHANDVRKPAQVRQEQAPHRNDTDTVRKAA